MTPGELRRWIGNELFAEPHMGLSAYMCGCDAGGSGLIIALDSYESEDDAGQPFTQDMALVLVKWKLGWAPTNWLEPLDAKR